MRFLQLYNGKEMVNIIEGQYMDILYVYNIKPIYEWENMVT